VREERRARFMEVAEEVSARRMQRKVGKTLKVLIDEVGNEGGIGRTAADAPRSTASSTSSRRRRHRSATRSAISCR
jgi:tRNA A37 methylthiotransferase MiaB